MKEHQAREILLETKIEKLIQDSGYISIKQEKIYGRSGDHDIFSYGVTNVPNAFVPPTRIICRYKYYAKKRVETYHIRDFSGIVSDVYEVNYSLKNRGKNKAGINICDRYNDVGCYFSTTAFTRSAQEYAWAHDIYLVSLESIEVLKPMLQDIEEFVTGLNENTINNINRSELIEGYAEYCAAKNINYDSIQGAIAVLNGVYPVLMVGTNNWISGIMVESQNSETGRVVVEQVTRVKNSMESKFNVVLNDSNIEFTVPNIIIDKLMERKDNNNRDGVIFQADIPYSNYKGKRGFATMELYLEGFHRVNSGYEQISFFNFNAEMSEE